MSTIWITVLSAHQKGCVLPHFAILNFRERSQFSDELEALWFKLCHLSNLKKKNFTKKISKILNKFQNLIQRKLEKFLSKKIHTVQSSLSIILSLQPIFDVRYLNYYECNHMSSLETISLINCSIFSLIFCFMFVAHS